MGMGAADAVNKWLVDIGMADNFERAYNKQKFGSGGRQAAHSFGESEDDVTISRRAAGSFASMAGDYTNALTGQSASSSSGSTNFMAGCLFCMAL